MTHEKEIKILMQDRATEAEAEKLLKNGTIIFESYEEYEQMQRDNGLEASEDDVTKVKLEGRTYYVMYVY